MVKSSKTSLRNKRFLKRQLKVLEAKQSECLRTRRQALKALAAIEDDDRKDAADLANALLNQMLNGNLANCCADEATKVSRAIINLKNGKYGICTGCEGDIPVERLRSTPWATTCIPCQEILEQLNEELSK